MRTRLEVFTVSPRIGMELYGQAHPVVSADSIIRDGSMSGLSGAVPPDALCRLDLIPTGYFRHRWAVLTPERTSSTCYRGPDTSKQLAAIYPSTSSRSGASDGTGLIIVWAGQERLKAHCDSAKRVTGSPSVDVLESGVKPSKDRNCSRSRFRCDRRSAAQRTSYLRPRYANRTIQN